MEGRHQVSSAQAIGWAGIALGAALAVMGHWPFGLVLAIVGGALVYNRLSRGTS